MTANTLSAIIASVALIAIIIGFLVGWVRGYQRSIVALIVTLACAVLAFFIAPLISDAILNIKVNAVVNGAHVATLQEYVIEYIKSIQYVGELMSSSETLAELILAAPAMVANILLFIVLFILLKIVLGLILYLPIALTVFSKKKLENKSKIKLLGAGLGVLGSLVVLAVFLVPVFGAVNIAQKTAAANEVESVSATREYNDIVMVSDNNEIVEVASGVRINFDKAVKEVNTYTTAFNNTWIVKFYRAIGIGRLSEATFDSLSTKEVNGQKVSISHELEIASEMLPYGKALMENFNNSKKITSETVENFDGITQVAYKSNVVSRVLSEALSSALTKWDNGETFIGIAKPEVSDSAVINSLVSKAIKVMKTTNVDSIKEDVSAVVNALRLAVNTKLTDALASDNPSNKVIEVLSDSEKNIVENLILCLTESRHIKNLIPEVINVGLDSIYKVLNVSVPETTDPSYDYYWVLANDSTNWSSEAETMQEIVGKLCEVYQSYTNMGESETIIDVVSFKDIGEVVDKMRESSLFADSTHDFDGPGKQVYAGILNHEMLANIVTTDIKTDLLNKYSNSAINVSDTFAEVDNMIKVAKNLADIASETSSGDISQVSKDDIVDILNNVTDENSVIGTMVSDANLEALGVPEDVRNDITTITNGLSGSLTDEQKEAEVEGIATVLDLAIQSQNSDQIVIDDTDELVSAIENSTIISDLLTDENSIVNKVSVGDMLDSQTKEDLATSIASVGDSDLQAALRKLFGIE